MDLKEISQLAGSNRHPWEAVRAVFFRDLIAREAGKCEKILDYGAGDGYLANIAAGALPKEAEILCVDENYTEKQIKEFEKNYPRLKFSTEAPNKKFDLIMLMDVIEHIPDDRLFVEELLEKNLAKGGRVLISVPAYEGLFSPHDVFLKHYRRYSPKKGLELVNDCGLKVLASGGLFHSLFFVRALEKFKSMLMHQKDVGVGQWQGGRKKTEWLSWLLNHDTRLTEHMRSKKILLPCLSWWCLCAKD